MAVSRLVHGPVLDATNATVVLGAAAVVALAPGWCNLPAVARRIQAKEL
jgi:hypothetical protein